MDHFRRGNKELIKELNRALVIDQIRANQPISRTDIARNTDLGLSTITYIVEELQKEDLVMEIGTGASIGGRKPVLLKFNEESGFVVGIKLEKKQIVVSVANLGASVLKKTHVPFSPEWTGEKMISLLIREIENLIKSFVPARRFFGIGIATSGLVDCEKKLLLHSPILPWENLDFSPVGNHFDVPLLIDNDANAFALAHIWTGKVKEFTHFVGVTVGTGVGAGIVINKELYRGAFGGAGELGHTIIQPEGSPCHCGQRGCLEMYAGDEYLVSEGQRLASLGLDTRLKEVNPITPEAIYQLAEEGDVYAREILLKQGEFLGIGLKNVVNLFNPGAIILGGEGLRGGEYLIKGIQREITTHFFAKHRQQLHILLSDLGDDVWLIGASALVLNELFKAPIYR